MKAIGFVLMALCGAAAAQDSGRSSGWIVIPAGEYQALRTRAYPPAVVSDVVSPVAATLTRVDYDLAIDGEVARGRASLTVDVLKDGWVRVPIPSGLLVREARLDGHAVSLEDSSALLEKRGRAVLALDVALPVTAGPGSQKLALPASASGVTRASVTLARSDLDLQVSGGFLSERSQSGGQTRWLAYGGGKDPLTFTWRRKLEEHRVELPLRQRGSLVELLGLGEDSSSLYAEVNLEVEQGAAREVRIALPEGVAVNQVLGATVGEWQDAKSELLVRFLEPVEHSARFVITGDLHLPRDGAIAAPLLWLTGVERESGGVAVEVLGAGEIRESQPNGLESVAPAELGAAVAARESPSLAAFRFRPASPPEARSLRIEVARYQQQAVLTANVEEARYRVLLSRDGKTLVDARYFVRNNQRNFVRIALPAGAVLWSASAGGQAIHPGQESDGSLLIPVSKNGGEGPPLALEILYEAPGGKWEDKGRADLALPTLDLPISRSTIHLYYPPEYKLTLDAGSFRPGQYQPVPLAPRTPPLADPAPQQADLLQQLNNNAAQAATQALVDRFRAGDKRRASGNTPTTPPFPSVGPSLYLISELTGENQAARVAWTYQHERKGGVK